MTPDELDTIRAAVAAATPGPWEYVRDSNYQAADCPPTYEPLVTADGGYDTIIDWGNGGTDADAQFIAGARQWVPDLLAHVDRLTVERYELAARLEAVRELHTRTRDDFGGDDYCHGCDHTWPCPTARAFT